MISNAAGFNTVIDQDVLANHCFSIFMQLSNKLYHYNLLQNVKQNLLYINALE